MIVYCSTKKGFLAAMDEKGRNKIYPQLKASYEAAFGTPARHREINSWQVGLPRLANLLRNNPAIPDDITVGLEYRIPGMDTRADVLLAGQDKLGNNTIILIELKDWSDDYIVGQSTPTKLKSNNYKNPELLHPSYQASSYKKFLTRYCWAVEEKSITIRPYVYLPNCKSTTRITDRFEELVPEAPVFGQEDGTAFGKHIAAYLKGGDKDGILLAMDESDARPTRALADQIAYMFTTNKANDEEMILMDRQQEVRSTVVDQLIKNVSKKDATANSETKIKKQVLIIEGGPGTGKSVVAITILADLLAQGRSAAYTTNNSAPRLTYRSKLRGILKLKEIDERFVPAGAHFKNRPNKYDALIVDEAHRLSEKSGMMKNLGENQIKEIITGSKLSVFFIDEDQRISLKDIGTKGVIEEWAKKLDAKIIDEMSLPSQFRCNGSSAFLPWLENALQMHETANATLDGADYDFRVFDDPQQLHDKIKSLNKQKGIKARMLAGYCWPWKNSKDPKHMDIQIGNYVAKWNLKSDGQAWVERSKTADEIGVVHTSQGLEVDYVGVIIGPDLFITDSIVRTNVKGRVKTDRTIRGWDKSPYADDPVGTQQLLDKIIRSTYRVLMTRGKKGCYIYCTDANARAYFKERLAGSNLKPEVEQELGEAITDYKQNKNISKVFSKPSEVVSHLSSL